MIEINLLPVELRQAEGTPMPRLATILGGSLLLALGVVFVAQYMFVEIPRTKENIRNAAENKKKKELEREEIKKIEAETAKIMLKVNALYNLERSRVRWARVLDSFSKCIPEATVARSFRVEPEAGGGNPEYGKRFKLTIQGMTTGEAYADCTRKLTETYNNFKKVFEVDKQADAEPAPGPTPVAQGDAAAPGPKLPAKYSKKLGLKFEEPTIVSARPSAPPAMKFPKPEDAAKFRMPPAGLDYVITISFYLPPPLTSQ